MDSQRSNRSYDTRFHYPQNSKIPKSRAPPQSSGDQFPPHPSVRIPPNVRAVPRQAPVGMGVSPRPQRGTESPRQMRPQQQAVPGPYYGGRPMQEHNFPSPPRGPPRAVNTQRSREFQPPPSDRYNMHDSYVSSIADEPTPKTTPGSRSPRYTSNAQKRDSGSIYADSTAPPSPLTAYPSSKVIPTDTFPTPSQGHRGIEGEHPMPPPVATTSLDPSIRARPGDISPVSSRTAAMNALGAAIAAGFSSQPVVTPTPSSPPSRTFSPVRMPFGEGEDSDSRNDTQEELAPPQLREFTPEQGRSTERTQQTPSTLGSKKSNDALLGLGIKQPNGGFSDKRGVQKRPPKLDIDAVRDMEARGSTTSLTDLIRRATKLASNLDRGKTASRLGMLNMYGSSEKLGQYGAGNRDSSVSDMISAFPAPASQATPRRDTMWPDRDGYENVDGSDKNKKRRCCGMSMPVFIAVFVIVIVLIAAAVLIPVFLILVPKQHNNQGPNLTQCAINYPCGNGGTSIVSGDACNCVCSRGFTGAHCDIAPSAACSNLDVKDGSTTYKDATMGTNLTPLFQDSSAQFNIPLNSSTILSIFSSSDLSCDSENNIVDFNTSSSSDLTPNKRFIIFPNLEPVLAPTPTGLSTISNELVPRATVTSTDGIVFATSTANAGSPSAAATSTVLSGSPAPSQTTSASVSAPTSGATIDVTPKQLEFAKIVVLYALQSSQTLSIAVNAKNQIGAVFESGKSPTSIEVGFGSFDMKADFKDFTISSGGTTVGGKT